MSGDFKRDMNYIGDRITTDAADGWPVEAGRYRLVVAHACPWANRSLITTRLLGLESAMSVGMAGPLHDASSWNFHLDPDGLDPVLGIHKLQEAFFNRYPDYPRGITVPAIVEVDTVSVVTNDFAQIEADLSSQWTAFHRPGAPDLWPAEHLDEMHEVNELIFHDVNNGVYKTGFASAQGAYEDAYDKLFARLDWLEERLSTRRFLVGDTITQSDIRLWTTLVRFDAVYHGHFKCNRNKLIEMPALWGYARDLFQTPGFGDTIDFDQIKSHYYGVHTGINPTGVVPKGPLPDGWSTAHGREALGGRPFGDGTPPAVAA
ncbi:MAG: glutathione S-transferase C-terminal domain-containing protein [Actinomycetota bacterium]